MNKLAVLSSFLAGTKNRYMQYKPNLNIEEKIRLASKIEGLDGLELCYPADFENPKQLATLMKDHGLGIPALNVASMRQGAWVRGSFTSENPVERQEIVGQFKRAMDAASEMGVNRIITCPLNDGHDYVFEMNYLDAYKYAEDAFRSICSHNEDIRVCIEYKFSDPRTRSMFAKAGETLSFCNSTGSPNLGVLLDIGHSIWGGERPAQALSMLFLANKLFYVHLNDNDRNWDWNMIPGAFHINELIEFFYYLKKINYDNDWYSFDATSKEVDTIEHFSLVARLTRKYEDIASKIDMSTMDKLMKERNPNNSFSYLMDSITR